MIERDIPAGMFKIAFGMGMGIAACAVVALLASERLLENLRPSLHYPAEATGVLFLGAMAAAVMSFGVVLRARAARARDWPTTIGHIAATQVGLAPTRASGRSAADWRSRSLFRARTEYTYVVAGHTYRGDRIHLGGATYESFRTFARMEAAKYEPGQAVTVSYDPDNSASAVLEPRASGLILIWIVTALLLILMSRVAGWL